MTERYTLKKVEEHMRIRPFFWCLLILVCTSVLIFAVVHQPHASALLQAHVVEQSQASVTTVEVKITDQQGLPIEGATISSSAHMTNMDMTTSKTHVQPQGKGAYTIHLGLNMSGPWSITIHAQADGFTPLQRTLFIQVE